MPKNILDEDPNKKNRLTSTEIDLLISIKDESEKIIILQYKLLFAMFCVGVLMLFLYILAFPVMVVIGLSIFISYLILTAKQLRIAWYFSKRINAFPHICFMILVAINWSFVIFFEGINALLSTDLSFFYYYLTASVVPHFISLVYIIIAETDIKKYS